MPRHDCDDGPVPHGKRGDPVKPIASLTLADAREIATKLCADRGVDLILPYGAGAIRR